MFKKYFENAEKGDAFWLRPRDVKTIGTPIPKILDTSYIRDWLQTLRELMSLKYPLEERIFHAGTKKAVNLSIDALEQINETMIQLAKQNLP